jgi:pimeloyl-ACP methyl ester carboxylesterase
LVPTVTELEWPIKPLIGEWTEVASYDAPGVGTEPPAEPPTRRAVAERGIEEMDRRGWDRCVVVGDEFGSATAALLASLVPDRVTAVGLGHPSLSLGTSPPRPSVSAEVLEAFTAMTRTNYRAYARALSQVTQGAYDDGFVERYIERVPQQVMEAYSDQLYTDRSGERLEDTLPGIGAPVVLAEHRSCLLWTSESFEDVAARFPDARRCACDEKPSVSPVFVEALREMCAAVSPE